MGAKHRDPGVHNPALIVLTILFVTIFSNQIISNTNAQDAVKGGKTGGGFSRFRESFNSFRQQQLAPKTQVQSISTQSIQRQQQQQQQQVVVPQVQVQDISSNSFTSNQVIEEQSTGGGVPEPAVYGSVQGTPGVDFPGLLSIPNTKFSCDGAPFDGMYADEATGCQVYHLCYQGRRESFLCGVGTVFNQAILNCDFWHSVECSKSSQYYHLNAEFGKSSSEPAAGGGSSSSLQQIRQQQVSVSSKFIPQPPPPVASVKSSFTQDISSQVIQRPTLPLVSNQQVFVSSNEFSSSGGKTSPPKVSSKVSSFSGFSGKTNFNSRQTSGLLSPALQLQRASGQFAAESSTMFKVARNGTAATSLTVNSADVESKGTFGAKTAAAAKKGRPQSQSGYEVSNEIPVAPSSTSLAPNPSQNEEWKPFFKSKLSTTSTSTTSTTESPTAAEPLAKPDQEPSFSSDSSSASTESPSDTSASEAPTETTAELLATSQKPAASDETPQPSSSPPPPTTTASPSVESSVESDVSEAVAAATTTTAAPPTTSPAADGQSSATATAATSSESPDEESGVELVDKTTSAAPASPGVEYAAGASTSTEAPVDTTGAATSGEEAAAEKKRSVTGSGSSNNNNLNKKRKKKKKRDKKNAARNNSTTSSH